MSKLKDILSSTKYTKYSPSLDDSDFVDLRWAIKSAEETSINISNDSDFFLVGRSKNKINDLSLASGSGAVKLNLKKSFRSFKGTIGPDATFPYVSAPDSIKSMSNEDRTSTFGSDADYIDNTNVTDKTYLTIGSQFNNIDINDSFLSKHKFRVFVSDIVSSNNYITFPRLKVLDANTVVTHNDSSKKVFEVKNNAVYIYPGEYKRCLIVKTCSNSIRNSAATTAYGGEVKYVAGHNRGVCARLATEYLKGLSTYAGVGFSNLVRHPISDAYIEGKIESAKSKYSLIDLSIWSRLSPDLDEETEDVLTMYSTSRNALDNPPD